MNFQTFSDYVYYNFTFVWIFVIIVLIIIAFLFLNDSRKAPSPKLKKLCIGYFAFILSYAFTRIFFFFADYYGEYKSWEDSLEFLIFIKLGYISSSIGLAIFFYVLERDFVPTKFVLTSITIISVVLYIFLPYNMMRIIIYIFQPIYLVEVLSIYIYLAIKGTGEIQRRALYAIISLIIFFIGIILDIRAITDLDIIPGFVAPICVTIGLVLFHYSQKFSGEE